MEITGKAKRYMAESCEKNCKDCTSNCDRRVPDKWPINQWSEVKKTIAVVSGKGGVGKSTVTALTAVALKRRGNAVGVLDCDITGPSIPRLFGLTETRAHADENGLYPARSKTGIPVMSMNLLLKEESDPVVWRGPVISGTIRQLWTETVWETLDVLLLDMPPGTGDVPLTVFQSIPLDGIVLVTSPQELVSVIAEKALRMARLMHTPVLGMVENMSYAVCPDCDTRIPLFGESRAAETAARFGIPLLAQLPFNPALTGAGDRGAVELSEDGLCAAVAACIEAL